MLQRDVSSLPLGCFLFPLHLHKCSALIHEVSLDDSQQCCHLQGVQRVQILWLGCPVHVRSCSYKISPFCLVTCYCSRNKWQKLLFVLNVITSISIKKEEISKWNPSASCKIKKFKPSIVGVPYAKKCIVWDMPILQNFRCSPQSIVFVLNCNLLKLLFTHDWLTWKLNHMRKDWISTYWRIFKFEQIVLVLMEKKSVGFFPHPVQPR